MNITGRLLWTPLAILVLLFATASVAWGAQVNLRYVGTGWDTTVDNFADGYPITISTVDAKGSLGASRLEIRAEWAPFDIAEIDCETGELEFGLVFSASVATFENQSQLFAYSNVGWMCVEESTGHYYGQVFGIYSGGAGKFVGATGDWQSDFDGFFLEPPGPLAIIGFRSITGTVKGNVVLPESVE